MCYACGPSLPPVNRAAVTALLCFKSFLFLQKIMTPEIIEKLLLPLVRLLSALGKIYVPHSCRIVQQIENDLLSMRGVF